MKRPERRTEPLDEELMWGLILLAAVAGYFIIVLLLVEFVP